MKRRTFIEQTAYVGAGMALLPGFIAAPRRKKIGVQLWSVRDVMIDAPEKTLEQIAAMGYDYIEHANYREGKFYGKSPAAFRALLKSLGLSMPSGHTSVVINRVDMDEAAFAAEVRKAADDAAEAGMKYLIQPWLDEKLRKDLSTIERVAEWFNRAGDICRSSGVTFGYHNHAFEFEKVGDKSIYQHLLDLTEPRNVVFEMDLYWVFYAEQDPKKWFDAYPGRFQLTHVKDMAKSQTRETIEVGEGSIDFAQIFEHSKTAGFRHYIVELEHYRTSSIEGITLAYNNLQAILKG